MACSVFLSRCLPFFLHPSPWCWRLPWLCLCARLCCVCTPLCHPCLSLASVIFIYFCIYLILLIFFYLADVCLPSYGLRCHCACMCVCFYICLHACVLLCGCCSLVSIFIFRKCFRCLRLSTASCKPTPSCIRASWPSRRRGSGRRLLVCRYTGLPSLYSPLEKQKMLSPQLFLPYLINPACSRAG